MKETYFTPENIANQASEFIEYCEKFTRPMKLSFSPYTSALLVLDMQAYFLNPDSHAYIPSAQAIVPHLKSLIHAYRSRGLPVIYTRHTNRPQDAGMMSIWWQDLITTDSPLSQIVPELEPGDSTVILKSQYDAFYGTELDAMLRANGVMQVLVSGVMTHLCCETTARSAFMHGFEVFFLVDGTATYNQQFHQASLLNLSHGFASLLLVDEALTMIEAR